MCDYRLYEIYFTDVMYSTYPGLLHATHEWCNLSEIYEVFKTS